MSSVLQNGKLGVNLSEAGSSKEKVLVYKPKVQVS
jgi:hypothetical protein